MLNETGMLDETSAGAAARPDLRAAYLEAAAVAAALLRDPAVAAAWDRPSVLAKLSVSGLAGHLARQVLQVRELLAREQPADQPIPLLDHYARSAWVGADVDDDVSVEIRRVSGAEAVDGPAALADRVDVSLRALQDMLAMEPAERLVQSPRGPWSLTLDDVLLTRLVEISVHCDDLAVSVGVPTPELPARVLEPVLALLCQLAARRHGPTAVLRALSRAERAPATIAAL